MMQKKKKTNHECYYDMECLRNSHPLFLKQNVQMLPCLSSMLLINRIFETIPKTNEPEDAHLLQKREQKSVFKKKN